MPKYFANKSQFTPSKTDLENGLQPVEFITGILSSVSIRPGNSSSGFWLVFRVKKDYGYTDVYFDALNTVEPDIERYEIFRGKVVTIRSANERPDLDTAGSESEETVRASLLKGVAAGNIQMDDLPILLEIAKGKDFPLEKWTLFKQTIENEGLEKTKEDIIKKANAVREEIEREKAKLSRVKALLCEVDAEKDKVLGELYTALTFLQGENSLESGRIRFAAAYRSDNIIPVGESHGALMDAFEKFRTKKGVYVVCGDKIHLIHSAYIENGGRAFLIGTSKEYLRTKPEEVRKLTDKFLALFSVPAPEDIH